MYDTATGEVKRAEQFTALNLRMAGSVGTRRQLRRAIGIRGCPELSWGTSCTLEVAEPLRVSRAQRF